MGDERSIFTPELSLHLIDLHPFTSYTVRVVALPAQENADSGSSSDLVTVRTPGDVPSGPPTNVTLEPHTATVSFIYLYSV